MNPGVTVVAFTCASCNGQISVEVAQPELYNGRSYSSLVWAHERPIVCVGCGAAYVLLVRPQIRAAFQLSQIPLEARDSPIILPV